MMMHGRQKKTKSLVAKSAKDLPTLDSPGGAADSSLLQSSQSYGLLADAMRTGGFDRIASTPNLIKGADRSTTAMSEKASSRGSLEPLGVEFEEFIGDSGGMLDIVSINALVTKIMGDLVDALIDARSRQLSAVLQKFCNTLSTQELFRRVMLDSIEWKLESCLSAITPIIAKGRSHRSGSAVIDALRAARCILLLFVTQYQSHITDIVSGGCLETIALTCVLSIPKVAAPRMEGAISPDDQSGIPLASKASKGNQVGNPHLVWTCFAILAEMIRGHLIDDQLPEEITAQVFSLGAGDYSLAYFGWKDWLALHSEKFLKKKQNQAKGAKQNNGVLQWSTDDIAYLDGLCLCLSGWQCSQSRAILYNRSETAHFGFVWKFMSGLSYLMAESPVEFVNSYVNAMPTEVLKPKSSSICLGLPSFIGICYEAWWDGQIRSKTNEPEQMPESDAKLLSVLDVFSGNAGPQGVKSLSKNLTKEINKIFRDVAATVESGDVPVTISVNIRKGDIQDSSGRNQVVTNNNLGASLIGECLLVSTWQQQYVLRICREFAGIHSTLAFMIQMDQAGDRSIFQGLHLEDRRDRQIRHQITDKFREMERAWKRDAKRVQRQNGGGDDDDF